MTCHASVRLGPLEVTEVEFFLPQWALVVRTKFVLITGQCWDTVNIIPSRSDLEFNQDLHCYIATRCIANLSNQKQISSVTGNIELVNNCNTFFFLKNLKKDFSEKL